MKFLFCTSLLHIHIYYLVTSKVSHFDEMSGQDVSLSSYKTNKYIFNVLCPEKQTNNERNFS